METAKISKKLLKRLPGYLAHLKSLPENTNVSATSMAKALGLGDVQLIGPVGACGIGLEFCRIAA